MRASKKRQLDRPLNDGERQEVFRTGSLEGCHGEDNETLNAPVKEGATKSLSTQKQNKEAMVITNRNSHHFQSHYCHHSSAYIVQQSWCPLIPSLNPHGSLAEGRSPLLCTGRALPPIAMILCFGSTSVGKQYFGPAEDGEFCSDDYPFFLFSRFFSFLFLELVDRERDVSSSLSWFERLRVGVQVDTGIVQSLASYKSVEWRSVQSHDISSTACCSKTLLAGSCCQWHDFLLHYTSFDRLFVITGLRSAVMAYANHESPLHTLSNFPTSPSTDASCALREKKSIVIFMVRVENSLMNSGSSSTALKII